ncbi:hypothetical protein [Streptomyces atroolivaceus]
MSDLRALQLGLITGVPDADRGQARRRLQDDPGGVLAAAVGR